MIWELSERGHSCVLVDAPTLIESGFHHECDAVISVLASPELRTARIIARDALSEEKAFARVSAQKDETLIIPINMRDGSLICRGKGNPEWNFTAPHGAGRLMKRSEAKASISLEEYREAMKGIYSTSVGESTIDESPMAYRSIDDIVDTVEPTVEIIDVITPVYNFKASKAVVDEETADGED
jgi:RNA-splicing ligase RtcB